MVQAPSIGNHASAAVPAPCPSVSELSALADGRLPESDSNLLYQHLTRCGRCDETFQRLASASSLVLHLRQAKVVRPLDQEPECQQLLAAARAIPTRGNGSPNEVSEESTDGTRLSTNHVLCDAAVPRDVERGPGSQTTIPREAAALAKIGGYQIKSLLGEGTYGKVYLAVDPDLDRLVALKVPKLGPQSKALIEALLREARTAARLKHPGIVTIYDAGCDPVAGCYIAMEYVEGKTLKALLAAGPIAPAEAARIVAEAAAAVHYAHKQGLVHRDLKPANLLIDSEGHVKVADFGLAIFEEQQRAQAGEYAGTIAYSSPEQIRCEVQHFDGRTDIWSLGVILYEALTGRRPFGGQHITDEILNRPPRPPRQIKDTIPPELERVVLKCCRQSTVERYSAAIDLAHDLKPRQFGSGWHGYQSRRWALVATGVLLPATALSLWLTSGAGRPISEPSLRNPEVIAWEPFNIHDEYAYDEVHKRFRFDAFGNAIFTLTRAPRETVDIQAVISVKRWEGFGGVCWDIRRLSEGGFRCLAIRVGRHDPTLPFMVELREFEIGSVPVGRQGVRGGRLFWKQEIWAPDRERLTLRVLASDCEVIDISLDGVSLIGEKIDIPKGPRVVQGPSGVGVCGQLAEISIYDFTVR